MTFDQFLRDMRATPAERRDLLWYLAFIRMRRMIERLRP